MLVQVIIFVTSITKTTKDMACESCSLLSDNIICHPQNKWLRCLGCFLEEGLKMLGTCLEDQLAPLMARARARERTQARAWLPQSLYECL